MGKIEYWNQPGTGIRMEIKDSGNIDKVLSSLRNSLTGHEQIRINTAGAEVYKEFLVHNFLAKDRPDSNGNMQHYDTAKGIPYDSKSKPGGPHDREKMAKTIIVAHERGRTDVGVGFSTEGKLAYIGRFINDGWDPRNHYAGPFPHVPGEFYFEKTEIEAEDEVKRAMANKLNRILGEIARRGGNVNDDTGALSPVGEDDD